MNNNQINSQGNHNQQNSNNPTPQVASNQNQNKVTAQVKKDFSDRGADKKTTVKLKRFKYKVKDQTGNTIESYFDAENKVDVESFLINKGLTIISIDEDKLSTKLGLANMSSSTKMKSKDLNFFLTQLSTYVKAGIPL